MATEQSPAIGRRRLRIELRRAREAANLTQDQVVRELDWSLSKLIRIETGAVGVSTTDLRALLQLYGITDPERVRELTDMARASRRKPAWWSAYRDLLSEAYRKYAELEGAASVIQVFNPLLVFGPLQTREYAHAIVTSGGPSELSDEDIEKLVEFRMIRQRELFGNPQCQVTVLLGEAAVRQLVGDPQAMREQLGFLRDSDQAGLTLRVVPFGSGAHPGLAGAFTILGFPDPVDDDVLCLDGIMNDIIERDNAELVSEYKSAFNRLEVLALSPEETSALLTRLIEDLK
ncbi:MAG TPA: helix-turn-helix transcriptional regulator [Micromonosporaceae bacterium]